MSTTSAKRFIRSVVPEEQTWNLTDLFSSEEEWKKELEAIEAYLIVFEPFKGQLHNGAETLLQCLQAQEELSMRLVKAAAYANLRQSEDGTDPTNQANSSLMASLLAKIGAILSFIDSEILSLPDGTVERFITEEEGLIPFANNLTDLLLKKKHQLSAETEEALAALGEVHGAPYAIYGASKLADMQFRSFVDDQGNELPNSFALFEDRYEFSASPAIRKNAYHSFSETLTQYSNTFAAVYATEVKKQVALSKLRNYSSVTEMLLQSQHVTEEMYHNQLTIILQELAPHMRKYAKLKQKVLGLDKMSFYDLKAPMDPDYNPETTYEEASKVILESLQVMGPEYVEIMNKGLTERWVDRADNVGKATGAFCSSPYGSHPYILITWTDMMRGAFVLTHELGHAGHFYLANKHQRIMNTRPSTYFVENYIIYSFLLRVL